MLICCMVYVLAFPLVVYTAFPLWYIHCHFKSMNARIQTFTFWGGAPRGVVPLCSLQSTLRSQRVNTERIEHWASQATLQCKICMKYTPILRWFQNTPVKPPSTQDPFRVACLCFPRDAIECIYHVFRMFPSYSKPFFSVVVSLSVVEGRPIPTR
jgi:hypothetical protein